MARVFGIYYLLEYSRMKYVELIVRVPTAQKLYNIRSFTGEQAKGLFRVHRHQLRKLFTGLGVYSQLGVEVEVDDQRHLYNTEAVPALSWLDRERSGESSAKISPFQPCHNSKTSEE